MLNRILYRKDPQLHSFFVDFEKKIFFKCYQDTEAGQSRYNYEVECHKKMSKSLYVPKLYNTYKRGCLLVTEMEFIPKLPLFEHKGITKGKLWEQACYNEKQIKRIHKHIDILETEIEKHGLVDEKGNIEFTFSTFHLMYDEIQDRLVMFDMAGGSREKRSLQGLMECAHVELEKRVKKSVLTNMNIVRHYRDEELFRELLFPRMPWSKGYDEEVFAKGEDLINEINKQGYITDKPLFINGIDICDNNIITFSDYIKNLHGTIALVEYDDDGIGEIACHYVDRGADKVIIKNSKNRDLTKKYIDYMSEVHPIYKRIEVL